LQDKSKDKYGHYNSNSNVPGLVTTDNFANQNKPYPMNRAGSQNFAGARGNTDFNSYFRSSAAAMFGSHAIVMPKIATNHVRAKF
jgi:hypothetical protein